MAKLTLLQYTQYILNDMNSDDNITDITDTIESQQVAAIVRDTYFDIIAIRDWDFLNVYDILTDANSASTPTKFTIPAAIGAVHKLWYRSDETGDANQEWTVLKYMNPIDFVTMLNGRSSGDSTVDVIDTGTGATLNIINDKMPEYWTSFDDDIIWCDSYDSGEETFLHEERTKIFAKKTPTWTHTAATTPTLSEELVPLLLNEAKARASLLLMQMPNEKAERWSQRLYKKYKALGNRTKAKQDYPNWGI